MSLMRLFLSGLLVAWGLILGAFTLHGYFDPNWQQRQMQAANLPAVASEPKAINAFKSRSQFVAARTEQSAPSVAPRIIKASATTDVRADPRADVQPAAKVAAEKKKKVADKADKTAKRPQQASVQWPWNLFSN